MAIRKEGGPLVVYDFYDFNYEQEHGPLQMLGPAVGVCNCLTLEKIYCMLVIRDNYLTNLKKGGGGAAIMGNTEQPP